MIKYEDASWHFGGQFPADSPIEYGGTHIALLLRWLFVHGFAGDIHQNDTPELVEQVRTGRLPATTFLFDQCDGKLTEEDVTAPARPFLDWYVRGGRFSEDYGQGFGELLYVAGEAEHDWDLFSSLVSRSYREYSRRAA